MSLLRGEYASRTSSLQKWQMGFLLLGVTGAVLGLLAMGNVHFGPVLKRVGYFSFLIGMFGQLIIGFLARRKL